MKSYQTPGVYIQEVSSLPPSVAEVATAIPAFIGFTEKGKTNKMIRITSLLEFQTHFGGSHPATFQVEVVNDEHTGAYNMGQITRTSADHFYLPEGIRQFYENGGGDCYVLSLGTFAERSKLDEQAFFKALDLVAKEDEPTILLFPDALYLKHAAYYAVVNHALKQCNDLQDRFTILDIHTGDTNDQQAIEEELKTGSLFRSSQLNLDYLKYGAVYTPYLNTSYKYVFKEEDVHLKGLSTKKLVALNDPLILKKHPDLYLKVKKKIEQQRITLPPSAAMAGIYNMVDQNRGVWKAPANVSVNSAISPSVEINHQDQEHLNVDPTAGKSINAIRTFPGQGILVWGARTLAGNDNKWRYISVRRLCITIEESVWKSSMFVVFEPNDANTWVKVKSMTENYLTNLWKQGGLAGPTPESAFFVQVGLGETMTAQDILEGRIIITMGIAVVRPAEFIILTLKHKMQQA